MLFQIYRIFSIMYDIIRYSSENNANLWTPWLFHIYRARGNRKPYEQRMVLFTQFCGWLYRNNMVYYIIKSVKIHCILIFLTLSSCWTIQSGHKRYRYNVYAMLYGSLFKRSLISKQFHIVQIRTRSSLWSIVSDLFCFRGCGSVHILFFRRIVSKRLFSIPDASRGRVAPANPRAAHAQPLQRNKNKKPLTSNEISGFWQG